MLTEYFFFQIGLGFLLEPQTLKLSLKYKMAAKICG